MEKNEAEEENQNFVLDQEELSEVLLKACLLYTSRANSVDKALYLSYEAYLEAAKEQYHCYAMPIGSPAGESYPWGPSFVKYLADGKTVSFEDIKNDILYAVDRGSMVEDYMG